MEEKQEKHINQTEGGTRWRAFTEKPSSTRTIGGQTFFELGGNMRLCTIQRARKAATLDGEQVGNLGFEPKKKTQEVNSESCPQEVG